MIDNISVQFIPHSQQRYPTVGDYWEYDNTLEIRISEMSNWKYMWLVLIHEMIEYVMVKIAGIPLALIDAFDKEYEEEREKGLHSIEDEAGMDKNAPYHKQHVWATRFERALAWVWSVNWDKYEQEVINL